MSTWFSSFSLPNPFKFDDDEDDDQDNSSTPNSSASSIAGVKQDLSALSQTFSHHLRGVAAFLAPPPSTPSELTDQAPTVDTSAELQSASSGAIDGIMNDLIDIGGSFKSLLSSPSIKTATGISKFASNFLQLRDGVIDEGDEYQELEDMPVIGGEVVDFARRVCSRPELWTEFPLSLPNDFNMSKTQREHATRIQQLVPSLAILRHKICSHLSNGQFWMIYFTFLLLRLDEADMELLSSSEIVQVRETLLRYLQNKRNAQVENSETPNTSEIDLKVNVTQGDISSLQKDVLSGTVNSGGGVREVETGKSEGSLKNEEASPGKSVYSRKHSENVEDVSFSDLEDEDNDLSDTLISTARLTQTARVSSASESNEWVGVEDVHAKVGSLTTRVKDSEGEELNDWFKVDDIDLDSLVAL